MISTLIGSIFGGIFRLAPEVLKWLDKESDRKHELAMMDKEIEIAKSRTELAMQTGDIVAHAVDVNAISSALEEQSTMSKKAGRFAVLMSALVRPMVTYWFVFLYSLVKLVSIIFAMSNEGDWKEIIIRNWTEQDWGLFGMIITFWFVGRLWERRNQ